MTRNIIIVIDCSFCSKQTVFTKGKRERERESIPGTISHEKQSTFYNIKEK